MTSGQDCRKDAECNESGNADEDEAVQQREHPKSIARDSIDQRSQRERDEASEEQLDFL